MEKRQREERQEKREKDGERKRVREVKEGEKKMTQYLNGSFDLWFCSVQQSEVLFPFPEQNLQNRLNNKTEKSAK